MTVQHIKKRIVYTPQFKHQVVKLVDTDAFAVKEIAIEHDIHENSLYRWIQDIETYSIDAFPGRGSRAYLEQSKFKQFEK